MRRRLPPIASRTAISFRLAVPRASSMFARLNAAMSNTTPDIESSAPATPTTSLSLCGRVPTESRASGASDSS